VTLATPVHPPVSAVGLDGVVAAESRLSRVDGLAGTLLIAGAPVETLAGRLPVEALFARLFALAEGRAVTAVPELSARLGAEREAAWARLGPHQALLCGADGIAVVRALLPLMLPEEPGPEAILSALHVAVAAWTRARAGAPPVAPAAGAGVAADLLRMATGDPDTVRAAALDAYLGAVVDHGLNASTFTARVVASTAADDLSAVVAALGALKGRLHGGAPGPVLDMLDAIARPERARAWLEAELAAGRRIMGMGHRVYRVRDPRVAVLERALESLPGAGARRVLAAAVEREAAALLERAHPGRRLRANVELGTAVLLDALGLPREAFTPVFACSRAAGWLAHATEQRRTGRLLRPRLSYVGPMVSG
jgi:citrate synthase